MSTISTHVLDTARGRPAVGLHIKLCRLRDGDWDNLGEGRTNDDGRLPALAEHVPAISPGVYRMYFDTKGWFDDRGERTFYPEVAVVFEIHADDEHYHVPLLISPFGYSTYRGS